jgi:hypothetical protein
LKNLLTRIRVAVVKTEAPKTEGESAAAAETAPPVPPVAVADAERTPAPELAPAGHAAPEVGEESVAPPTTLPEVKDEVRVEGEAKGEAASTPSPAPVDPPIKTDEAEAVVAGQK